MFPLNDFENSTEFLVSLVIKELQKSVDIKGGRIQPTELTQSIIKKSIRGFYNSNQYRNSLTKYLKNIENYDREKQAMYGKQGMSASNITEAQKLAISEHISYLNESGVNEKFNQPLRKIISQNIRLGKSLSEIKEQLSNFAEFKTNKQYFVQTAQQGADAYASILDQKIMDKYKSRIKGLRIVGSIIETSSPQCIEAVEMGRELTIEQWEKLLKKYKNQIIDGTTVQNLSTYKLHHGCRHQFSPFL